MNTKGQIQVLTISAITALLVVMLAVAVIVPLNLSLNTASASNYLEERGYTVLPATALSDLSVIKEIVEDLHIEASHRSYLFPDQDSDINLTCTFTAGTGEAYGPWAEIIDSGATTLGSVAASHPIHISALRIRSSTVADVLYVIVVGYGPTAEAVTIIDPHEFGSGTKQIDSDEQVRFRPPAIPQGQKVYYRMKCETDGAQATIELRYHYDE